MSNGNNNEFKELTKGVKGIGQLGYTAFQSPYDEEIFVSLEQAFEITLQNEQAFMPGMHLYSDPEEEDGNFSKDYKCYEYKIVTTNLDLSTQSFQYATLINKDAYNNARFLIIEQPNNINLYGHKVYSDVDHKIVLTDTDYVVPYSDVLNYIRNINEQFGTNFPLAYGTFTYDKILKAWVKSLTINSISSIGTLTPQVFEADGGRKYVAWNKKRFSTSEGGEG